MIFFFFFFQAEDGIRDLTVTGVQTCALPISVNVHHPEQQVHKRDDQKDKPRQREQEMRGCIEVAKPLWKRESAHEQRILRAQDLHHPASPADALANVRREAFGGQTRCLWNIDVSSVPTPLLHAQRLVYVFSYGLYRDASDLIQRFPPEHRA